MGVAGRATVNVAVLLLVFAPGPAVNAPGAILTAYAAATALLTVIKIVQLPDPGMKPMPKL